MTTTKQPGFAPAASPHAATAVHTPEEHIIAGETSIPSQGENMPAYHARPKNADGPLPIVIVVQEIFGVHEHIRDLCRRLAQEGYLAIAPELYFRQGDPNEYHDIPTLFKELVTKVPDAQVLADLDHVASWAARHGGDAHRLLITGFCWGGKVVWQAMARFPTLDAGVAWYGRLSPAANATDEQTAAGRPWPIDLASELKAPVLGLYGGADSGIPNETVKAMNDALSAAGRSDSSIILYDDAPHGFHADYRASYREADAKDGWRRLLALFKSRLKN